MAEPFKIYNTLSRNVEDFEPLAAGAIKMYVCGMTVYDEIHVGHARAFVIFDAFVRYLRHRGWQVDYVRNFTDVDDKIIKRANECGEDSLDLANRYIDAFRRDVTALGLVSPDSEPRVTESMDDVIGLIAALVDKGHAYVADGSVWFAVETCSAYGKLSGRKVDEMRASDDSAAGKRAPCDFALWKAAKPGEPTWESPWGPGRPGWHIECSAMSKAALGDTIDIHGGGLDLVFPHHENEIAQSECGNRAPFARYWMHNGLLNVSGGQKMGKSLGNAINVKGALERYPAEAVRLYYLQSHYRSPLPWDGDALDKALTMLARLYEAREVAEAMGGSEPASQVAAQLGGDAKTVLELAEGFAERFHAALDNDFNTAQALGHLFELARAVNRFANHKKAKKRGGPVVAPALAAFALLADAIGVMAMSTTDFQSEVKAKRLGELGVSADEIEALLNQRAEARAAKDWARADAIRDELVAKHIDVRDRPDGATEWRVKL